MSRYSPTEQVGVHAVGLVVAGELKWIFREQVVVDMGIDAHLEVVNKDDPTGRLIALQIKTGKSYFKEQSETSIVYRGKNAHLDYWTKHALPVVIVLHDIDEKKTYWESVTAKNIVKTKKGWKLDIPKEQVLDARAAETLSRIADGPSETTRMNKLRLASPLMKQIIAGHDYFLEAEEWINKTSGRGSVRIVEGDMNGSEQVAIDWRNFYASFIPYETVFKCMFPWADFVPDHDLYAENAYNRYLQENGIWDSEEQEMRILDQDEWSEYVREACSPGVRPYEYEGGGGEIASYRLQLSVNDIGKAFLELDKFLTSDQPLLDQIL